jgi:hypothetical protein
VSKSQPSGSPSVGDVEEALARAYVGGETRFLRKEDRQKAKEIAALLAELGRIVPTSSGSRKRARSPIRVVDACSGKATAGVLFAHFATVPVELTVIERDPKLAKRAREGAANLGVACNVIEGDISDAALWPANPDIVIAMHACGVATDFALDRAIAAHAKRIFSIPCCYGSKDHPLADELGLLKHGAVRVRFSRAMIDAERTARLEAAGYETEVVDLVEPTVTPFNLLWRAKFVHEAVRTADGARAHQKLHVRC